MKRKAGVSIAIFVSLFSLAFALNSYTSRPFPSMPPESNENEFEIFQVETPMTDARPEPFLPREYIRIYQGIEDEQSS
ncbi:hypothetical protein [Bacillus sp. FJAT-44742]|uniref:hypothetical protein n=1 Tax=Bacillus sp. FJAT-44742 TaxID=2014005 RepID=UPI000C234698|nr:hypothetical protein [Bacillus sp. FJAT-44742]